MTTGRSDYGRMDMNATNLMAGAEVFGMDNEKIGNVADVGQNSFLVQKGWLFIQDLYLPTSVIARSDADRVYLNVTKAQAEDMARDELPATDDTWYGARATGYTDDAAMTDRTMTSADRVTDTTYGTDTPRGVRGNEDITVPVVEEQLTAGVRDVAAGSARIAKTVTHEQQTIDVPVEREEVYVTERAVNRPATDADMQAMDREIEIPLREQEVVTQKQAVVTGEVNIRKEVRRDTEQVTDTVRREEVHVENADSPRVHFEGNLNDTQRRRFETMSAADQARYGSMTATEREGYDRANPWDDGRRDEGILDRARDAIDDTGRNISNR